MLSNAIPKLAGLKLKLPTNCQAACCIVVLDYVRNVRIEVLRAGFCLSAPLFSRRFLRDAWRQMTLFAPLKAQSQDQPPASTASNLGGRRFYFDNREYPPAPPQ